MRCTLAESVATALTHSSGCSPLRGGSRLTHRVGTARDRSEAVASPVRRSAGIRAVRASRRMSLEPIPVDSVDGIDENINGG